MITLEQFVRGMDVIQSYLDMMTAINEARVDHGLEPECAGQGESLLAELVQQLEERCGDGSEAIETFLFEGPVKWLHDGNPVEVLLPEQLWEWWRLTETGPFGEAAGK